MKKEKIYPETLLQLMLDAFKDTPEFVYISGIQPFSMKFSGKQYYVYVKNLSSAFFQDRPDTTRAQLPIRDDFDEIKLSPYSFVFLGYDQDNDVLVCWNYHIVKTRLNEKKSVSFYSRQFFQDEVVSGSFLRKRLKNGDEPILFKRKDLSSFFSRIESFFNKEGESDDNHIFLEQQEISFAQNNVNDEINSNIINGKIVKIDNEELILRIKQLILTNHTPDAIKAVAEYYKGKYPAMKLRDWYGLVKSIGTNSQHNIENYSQDNNHQTEGLVADSGDDNTTDENHIAQKYHKPGKKKSFILRVTYPNGKIVEERLVYKTLLYVINTAGAERVKSLGIIINGINLISNILNPKYSERQAQKPVGNGLFVMTCSDTDTKLQQIKQISDAFGLNLKVEKVSII